MTTAIINYKRLTFNKTGGGESQRVERMKQGFLNELNTPQYWIPFSTEGTTIYQNIDRNMVAASIINRNRISELLDSQYPDFEIRRFSVVTINQTEGTETILTMKYLPTGETVNAEVF